MPSYLTPTWIILSGSIGCCASVCIGQCRCISSARRVLPTASSTKLKAYTLNLLGEDSCDFVITVAEFTGERFDRRCEFHARETFRQRECRQSSCRPERSWMKMNFGS